LRAKTEQSETLRKEFDIQAEAKHKQAVQSAVNEVSKQLSYSLLRTTSRKNSNWKGKQFNRI
jgi:hypothetical protein